MRLGDTRHLLGLANCLTSIEEVQITKQHQEHDRGRWKNILEGSGDGDVSSLMGRTW